MKKEVAKQLGFTLVETLLALAIMATALTLLAQSWSGAFSSVRKTQLNFEAASLLERKMIEIDALYRGKSLDAIPEEQAEDFGEDFPQYSWKLKSKKFEFPDLTNILTSKDGGADQLTMSLIKQLGDGISKAIKEVTVTVIFKPPGKNRKPLEHSITTYYVDFDKELTFGVPTGGG
jgi:general secretion pathway protein I